MIRRLVIFLIRRRLRLAKYETFQFENQKSPLDYYYFYPDCLMKAEWMESTDDYFHRPSSVSLNYLLSDECEIKPI